MARGSASQYTNWEGSVAQYLDKQDEVKRIQQAAAPQSGVTQYWGGSTSDQSRAADRADWNAKLDRIDKMKMFQDNLTVQKDITALAHPMSQLSGQEQRMAELDDLEQKRKLEPGALISQENENALKLGQATHATGIGNYYGQQASKEEQQGRVFSTLSPQEQENAVRGFKLPASSSSTIPITTAIKYGGDTTSRPVQDVSQEVPLPVLPIAQPTKSNDPYTDAYMNFSQSPLGLPLTVPNKILQNVTFPMFEGLGNAAKWAVSPRKKKDKNLAFPNY